MEHLAPDIEELDVLLLLRVQSTHFVHKRLVHMPPFVQVTLSIGDLVASGLLENVMGSVK